MGEPKRRIGAPGDANDLHMPALRSSLFGVLLALLLSTLYGCFGPLVNAASQGNTQKVRALLDQGHTDRHGQAIFQASCNGKTEVVHLLLERGGNANTVSREATKKLGFSALQCAASNGHAETVSLLLKYGANPDKRAIELARQKGYTTVVQVLVDAQGSPTTSPAPQPAARPSTTESAPPIY